MSNDPSDTNKRNVYSVQEQGGRTFWTKIGTAWINRDGSVTVRLDAIPANGTMEIREAPRVNQQAKAGV